MTHNDQLIPTRDKKKFSSLSTCTFHSSIAKKNSILFAFFARNLDHHLLFWRKMGILLSTHFHLPPIWPFSCQIRGFGFVIAGFFQDDQIWFCSSSDRRFDAFAEVWSGNGERRERSTELSEREENQKDAIDGFGRKEEHVPKGTMDGEIGLWLEKMFWN